MLLACQPVGGDSGTATSTAGTLDATTGEPPTSTSSGATGFDLPPECETPDPAVSAAFTIELPDWPPDVSLPHFDYVDCVVDGVTSDAELVTTTLTCDVEGVARPVVTKIAAAPEGDVVWAAGDAARLRYWDIVGEGTIKYLDMRPLDSEDVLLLGLDWTGGDALEVMVKPLTVDIEFVCDPEMGENHLPTLLRFRLPDGQAEVGIISGHRGVLPIDADDQYVIDLAEASGLALHPESRVDFLLRRIRAGG